MKITLRDLIIDDLEELRNRFTDSEESFMSIILILTTLFGFIPIFIVFKVCFYFYILNLFKIPTEEFELIFSGF